MHLNQRELIADRRVIKRQWMLVANRSPHVQKSPVLLLLLLLGTVGCGRLGISLIGASPGVQRDAGRGGYDHPDASRDGGAARDGGLPGDGGAPQDSGASVEPNTCTVVCENQNGIAECAADSCTLTCANGFADCDGQTANGCETSVASTSEHCGKCENVCLNDHGDATCAEGLCAPSCTAGFADCDGMAVNGCETDLNTVARCGDCAVRCSNAHGDTSCDAGVCSPTCDATHTDCDGDPNNGCETNTDSDPRHCGTCTNTCNFASQICVSGACEISPCGPGLGECDGDAAVGCETDTQTSPDHCGFCGNMCTIANGSPECTGGECLVGGCDSNFGDCDSQASNGCETALASTTAHCGACERSCVNAHGTTSCSGSECVPACASQYGDCDVSRLNGCETPLDTVSNCGSCGMACPPNGGTPVCNSGVCGTVCNLNGRFALKMVTQTSWPLTTYLRAGNGPFTHWMMLELSQSGTSLSTTITICGSLVPDFSSNILSEKYGVTYANLPYDGALMPGTSSTGTLGGLGPGSSFMLARSALLIGATMADPINGAWPSRASLTNLNADGDNDGKPGVTGAYKNGSGYSYVPANSVATARAMRGYLATRVLFQLNGTLTSCSQSSGSATVHNIDTHTLGCRISGDSRDCDGTESNNLDTRAPAFDPQTASYQLVKIDDNLGCSAVRAALP